MSIELENLVKELNKTLPLEEKWEYRRDLLRKIAELATPEAIQTICSVIEKEHNSSVKIRGISILKENSSSQTISTLFKMLDDWDSGVRIRAIQALLACDSIEIVKFIPQLTEYQDREYRADIKKEVDEIFNKIAQKLDLSKEKLIEKYGNK
ncbi:MAG: HEAT repeat domain-containing protein [Candidatus Thorarchaeota archaeon]